MITGRNIGDHEAAAREEREAGIGWEVYDDIDGGSVIVGIHPHRSALRHSGFAFSWIYIPTTNDLLIPAHTASEVVEALHSIDYGARIVDNPSEAGR